MYDPSILKLSSAFHMYDSSLLTGSYVWHDSIGNTLQHTATHCNTRRWLMTLHFLLVHTFDMTQSYLSLFASCYSLRASRTGGGEGSPYSCNFSLNMHMNSLFPCTWTLFFHAHDWVMSQIWTSIKWDGLTNERCTFFCWFPFFGRVCLVSHVWTRHTIVWTRHTTPLNLPHIQTRGTSCKYRTTTRHIPHCNTLHDHIQTRGTSCSVLQCGIFECLVYVIYSNALYT